MQKESEILCLNPLIQASSWLYSQNFLSSKEDFTWTNQKLNLYHYTIPAEKVWKCNNCGLNNELYLHKCKDCDTKQKSTRDKTVSTISR